MVGLVLHLVEAFVTLGTMVRLLVTVCQQMASEAGVPPQEFAALRTGMGFSPVGTCWCCLDGNFG